MTALIFIAFVAYCHAAYWHATMKPFRTFASTAGSAYYVKETYVPSQTGQLPFPVRSWSHLTRKEQEYWEERALDQLALKLLCDKP